MAGWFELSKSSDNQFRFVLKAGMVYCTHFVGR